MYVCQSRRSRPGHCDIQIREQFTGQCSGRGDREADTEATGEADEHDDDFLAEQLSSCQFCSCTARDVFAQGMERIIVTVMGIKNPTLVLARHVSLSLRYRQRVAYRYGTEISQHIFLCALTRLETSPCWTR
jgi:hypothetical protein